MWGGSQKMLPFLKVCKDGEVLHTIPLQERDTWVLGRHGECDIQVGHLSASRQHIEIQVVYATLEFIVTDLQSVHGTRVNGVLLDAGHPYVAKSNDVIQLGESSQLCKVQWVPLSEIHEYLQDTQALSLMESVMSVESLPTNLDRVHEHPSDSGSKAKFIYKLNQGSRLGGQENAKKPINTTSLPDEHELESRLTPEEVKMVGGAASASQVFENNESRSSTKKQIKKATPAKTLVYEETDTSSTRKLSHTVDDEHSLGTPARRLAFTTLQPSDLNIRLGTTPNPTPDKRTPSKSIVPKVLTPIKAAHRLPLEEVEQQSPILSVQHVDSSSTQILRTEDEIELEPRFSEEVLSTLVEDHLDEDTIESALERLSLEKFGPNLDPDEQQDSDKENIPVVEIYMPGPGCATETTHVVGSGKREPLQTLRTPPPSLLMYRNRHSFTSTPVSPATSYGSMRFRLPRQHRQMAQEHVELGRQWHIVVDTNCLLDAEALKALRKLEGIHETCLIIPKIVVRELDCLRSQESWRIRANFALEWIAYCMEKMPFWIHVQSSSENMNMTTTPPQSPSIHSRNYASYAGAGDLLSPTLEDHVLDCALLFHETVLDGRVALLSEDTALKIKAMAEGLVVDSSITFSDSLLNPYSNRFIYSGSTPIGRCSHQRDDGMTTPCSTTSNSSCLHLSSSSGTPRSNWRDDFRIRQSCQLRGLQVLLT